MSAGPENLDHPESDHPESDHPESDSDLFEFFAGVSFPALLRAARRTYGAAVREALAQAGYHDLPANGPYVLGGIARNAAPMSDIITSLGVSKQAAGQLVDTLVERGYLSRTVDEADRRRLTVMLTERGRAAAGAVRSAVDEVDRELAEQVGVDQVVRAKMTLGAIVEIGEHAAGHGLDRRPEHADHVRHDGPERGHPRQRQRHAAVERPAGDRSHAVHAEPGMVADAPAQGHHHEQEQALDHDHPHNHDHPHDEPRRVLALRAHLEATYGIEVVRMSALDVGVLRVDPADGPSWVARRYPSSRPLDRVAGDAVILGALADRDYPSERWAGPDPVSVLDGSPVMVTEYVDTVPRSRRAETIRGLGGLRLIGELLGRLQTLDFASAEDALQRRGGCWHHLGEGDPDDELEAADAQLRAAEQRLATSERAAFRSLRAEIDDLRGSCDGLPEALVHPDLVLGNVVASPTQGLVIVDWAGTGRAARLWSLGYLLFVEGAKDLRRVDRVVAGYQRYVQPEPEEFARLAALARIRPLTLQVWSFCAGRKPIGEAAAAIASDRELAEAVANRAAAAFDAEARTPRPERRGPNAEPNAEPNEDG